jgi:dTDP-4-amino-4,6-dideoxygalactose transaminase
MIQMNDFTNLADGQRKALIAAFERVLDSGHFVLGQEVQKFEENWAQYCGTKYAIGVGNGLDAIEIGLRAAGIGLGDEVITTPMTAAATVLGILRAGATPVLADIHLSTGLLDRTAVEKVITPRTKAVLLVHLFGQVREMQEWKDLCDSYELLFLEDAAQAHGAAENDVKAGNWGTFGAFSFYPTKNLGAIGDAGAITTSDPGIAERARSIRNYGQKDRYQHDVFGLNSRLDELQAALLNEKIQSLNTETDQRRINANLYRASIDEAVISLLEEPLNPENHVHHLFVARTGAREKLQTYLHQSGVQTLIHYPVPMHKQVAFAKPFKDRLTFPNAEGFAQTCLSLPVGPQLRENDVLQVCDLVNSFKL